jgi:5-methylcytosine-specific restriction endonuclease McrA
MHVLALDITGTPREWIGAEEAVKYMATDSVAWSIGNEVIRYRGGYQHSGAQSVVTCNSIIALKGKSLETTNYQVMLTNKTLFGRDRYRCAYCGNKYFSHLLSRDHIVPTSRGGANSWQNCITACGGCNNYKGNKLLSELDMHLLFQPYVPNLYEAMAISNRMILPEQLAYLQAGFPQHSRLLDSHRDIEAIT